MYMRNLFNGFTLLLFLLIGRECEEFGELGVWRGVVWCGESGDRGGVGRCGEKGDPFGKFGEKEDLVREGEVGGELVFFLCGVV